MEQRPLVAFERLPQVQALVVVSLVKMDLVVGFQAF
jgi:hypothetical protein